MLAITALCLGWIPWHVQTRGYWYWRENEPGNLSFMKKTLARWISESWTQKRWDRFGWRRLLLGGNNSSWGPPRLGEAGRAHFSNYTLAFASQLRKSTENLSQGSWLVSDASLRRLGRLIRGSLDWPAEHVPLVCLWVTSVSPWLVVKRVMLAILFFRFAGAGDTRWGSQWDCAGDQQAQAEAFRSKQQECRRRGKGTYWVQ
jgi:hypothetical protein